MQAITAILVPTFSSLSLSCSDLPKTILSGDNPSPCAVISPPQSLRISLLVSASRSPSQRFQPDRCQFTVRPLLVRVRFDPLFTSDLGHFVRFGLACLASRAFTSSGPLSVHLKKVSRSRINDPRATAILQKVKVSDTKAHMDRLDGGRK